jgi:hypothetical protein
MGYRPVYAEVSEQLGSFECAARVTGSLPHTRLLGASVGLRLSLAALHLVLIVPPLGRCEVAKCMVRIQAQWTAICLLKVCL